MAKTNAELLKEIEGLKKDLLAAGEANDELMSDNEYLNEENVTIKCQLLEQEDVSAKGSIEWELCESITRNDIIKAMLPQIRMQYARPDTQNLLAAVNTILETLSTK